MVIHNYPRVYGLQMKAILSVIPKTLNMLDKLKYKETCIKKRTINIWNTVHLQLSSTKCYSSAKYPAQQSYLNLDPVQQAWCLHLQKNATVLVCNVLIQTTTNGLSVLPCQSRMRHAYNMLKMGKLSA